MTWEQIIGLDLALLVMLRGVVGKCSISVIMILQFATNALHRSVN